MNKILKRSLTQTRTADIRKDCGSAGWKRSVDYSPLADARCDPPANVGRMYFMGLFCLSFALTAPRLPLPSESIWNAASFYQESSYLYFPTLQAELASDISFYFKSSAPSGVFLENLGLKDFIRLELTCESTLTLAIRLHRPACTESRTRTGAGAGASGGAVRGGFIISPPLREHEPECR